MRGTLLASSTATSSAVPRIAAGCAVANAEQRVELAMASMKPRAKRVGGNAERADAVFEWHALEDVRIGRSRLDQRATHRFHELQQLEAPGAMLGHLARATGHDVLVTFAAGLGVERGPQPVSDRLDFLEDEPVVVEGTQRHHGVFVDGVECRPLRVEPVGAIVERRGRLAERSARAILRRASSAYRRPALPQCSTPDRPAISMA